MNKNAELLAEIYRRLLDRYGDPHWWPAETPYEVIVGAILTQNTAWVNVEKAIANFAGALSPEYVLRLDQPALAEIIRPAGFFNQKAGYILTVTLWFERYGFCAETVGKIPMEILREELLSLKGIGKETADSILLYAFGFPTFVVDAYTTRHIGRLRLEAGRGYDSVKAYFERHLERDSILFNRYHALIVLNAKAHCRKTPLCDGCPLSDLCVKKTC